MNRPARAWSPVLAAVTVAASLLFPAVSAEAKETCEGRPVTVSSSGGRVVGTEHDDVIVSHGQSVRARGGNDLICVFGSGLRVDAGPGYDYIDAAGAEGGIVATLGTGDDVFLGSPGADTVDEGLGPHDPRPTGDTGGRDIIRTGGGRDIIDAGDGGSTLGPDRIAAGPGADTVRLHELVPGMLLNPGPGLNSLSLIVTGTSGEEWFVDAVARTLARDDSAWSWHGNFTQFSFHPAEGGSPGSFAFVGSWRNELLTVDACSSVVRGGAGDDVVRLSADDSCRAGEHVAKGGAGDDRLSGTDRPDLLVGGPGHDRADGRGGHDTCRAEVTRSCEQT